MANCLVLGANGFLGSHLVDSLISQNHFVRAFDKYVDDKTRFTPSNNIELFPGEFLNESDLAKSLENIDYVFHLVSTTTPISSEDNPLVEIDTNIRYSVELFSKCVEKRVKKVIFASSGGSIYGNASLDKINEDILPEPISPYAIGKLTVEKFLSYFRAKYGLESVVYRISNPYGSRQSLNARQGVIPIFLNQVINDEPITIYGDGSMVRDYIYVSDVVKMISRSFIEAKSPIYNLGSGVGVSVNEIVESIYSVVGQTTKLNHVATPSTFVQKNVLDVTRFVDEFGIVAEMSIYDGIKATWEYYLETKDV